MLRIIAFLVALLSVEVSHAQSIDENVRKSFMVWAAKKAQTCNFDVQEIEFDQFGREISVPRSKKDRESEQKLDLDVLGYVANGNEHALRVIENLQDPDDESFIKDDSMRLVGKLAQTQNIAIGWFIFIMKIFSLDIALDQVYREGEWIPTKFESVTRYHRRIVGVPNSVHKKMVAELKSCKQISPRP